MSRSEALTPVQKTVVLTSADVEYVIPAPKGTKYCSVQNRTAFDMRGSFIKGKVRQATPVEPFFTIKSGSSYSTPEKVSWSRTLVSQVDLITVAGTWLQNDKVTMTIGAASIVVTLGTLVSTDALVATTLRQAWNNETLTDSAASFTPERGGQQSTLTSRIDADNLDTTDTAAAIVYLTNERAGEAFTLVVTTDSVAGTPTESTDTAASSTKAKLFLASDQAGVVAEVVFFKSLVN